MRLGQAGEDRKNGTKARLRIIVALWIVVFVAFLTLQLISRRAVNRSAQAVERRAAAASATPTDVLADMFTAGDQRIAAQLGVDPTAVTVSQPNPPAFCVVVKVNRVISERTLTFRLAENRFERVSRC